jgi:hypothetical protein
MERTSVYFKRPQNDMFFGLSRAHLRSRPRHEEDDEDELGAVLLGPTRELKQKTN